MSRSHRRPAVLAHPDASELDLFDVLHALSDPTRMTIVRTLVASQERSCETPPERSCGTFPVDVVPSTLTHHLRVLREAGVIRQRDDGNRRWTSLRESDLAGRFPGLLDTIVAADARQQEQHPDSSEAGR